MKLCGGPRVGHLGASGTNRVQRASKVSSASGASSKESTTHIYSHIYIYRVHIYRKVRLLLKHQNPQNPGDLHYSSAGRS